MENPYCSCKLTRGPQVLLDHVCKGESGPSDPAGRAADAMQAAQSVKVYEPEATARLQQSLLAMLQYNDGEGELCFAVLDALVMFISQRYTFAKNLGKVSILGTNEAAVRYLKCGGEVSEFRRLRKWLHLDPECQQTIDCAKSLCAWCETDGGQDILRNLNIEEYIVHVLKMRLSASLFPEVLRTTMLLVGAFCRGNKTNQAIFSRHMDSILLKLLREPLYYASAAKMIEEVVYNNERLSVRFSGLLVNTISELTLSPGESWLTAAIRVENPHCRCRLTRVRSSADHGRQQVLLELLDTLLIVEDHPVSVSQVQVCKGAMVSRELIETEGDHWPSARLSFC